MSDITPVRYSVARVIGIIHAAIYMIRAVFIVLNVYNVFVFAANVRAFAMLFQLYAICDGATEGYLVGIFQFFANTYAAGDG